MIFLKLLYGTLLLPLVAIYVFWAFWLEEFKDLSPDLEKHLTGLVPSAWENDTIVFVPSMIIAFLAIFIYLEIESFVD